MAIHLLFKLDRRREIPCNDKNNDTSMVNLLRLLSEAERIVKETDCKGSSSTSYSSNSEFCLDLHENKNDDDPFTPSIFDSIKSIDRSLSSACNTFQMMNNDCTTDPFEPTPLGPNIHVVQDVDLSTLNGNSRSSHATSNPNLSSRFQWTPLTLGVVSQPRPVYTASASSNFASSVESSPSKLSNTRKYQDEQWKIRFQELLAFQQQHGHSLVPHACPENPKLSQWVKR
jgi:Helicase associated domain